MKIKFLFLLIFFGLNQLLTSQTYFREGGKMGLKNHLGNIMIEAHYDSISIKERNSVFEVWQNGKCGILNEFGKVIVPIQYGKIEILFSGVNTPHLTKYQCFGMEKHHFYDYWANRTFTDIDSLVGFRIYKDSLVGMYLIRGDLYAEPEFTKIEILHEANYEYSHRMSRPLLNAWKGNQAGILSTHYGHWDPTESEAIVYTNGLVDLMKINEKFGLVPKDVKSQEDLIIYDTISLIHPLKKFKYPDLKYPDDGFNFLLKKENKFGVANRFGKIVLPVEFDNIKPVFDKFYMVEKEGRVGLYTSDGELGLPIEYLEYPLPDGIKNKRICLMGETSLKLFTMDLEEIPTPDLSLFDYSYQYAKTTKGQYFFLDILDPITGEYLMFDSLTCPNRRGCDVFLRSDQNSNELLVGKVTFFIKNPTLAAQPIYHYFRPITEEEKEILKIRTQKPKYYIDDSWIGILPDGSKDFFGPSFNKH
jgi:hypothetical protein